MPNAHINSKALPIHAPITYRFHFYEEEYNPLEPSEMDKKFNTFLLTFPSICISDAIILVTMEYME
jgi:hypothetical protein